LEIAEATGVGDQMAIAAVVEVAAVLAGARCVDFVLKNR
jgi:hypothetical protein